MGNLFTKCTQVNRLHGTNPTHHRHRWGYSQCQDILIVISMIFKPDSCDEHTDFYLGRQKGHNDCQLLHTLTSACSNLSHLSQQGGETRGTCTRRFWCCFCVIISFSFGGSITAVAAAVLGVWAQGVLPLGLLRGHHCSTLWSVFIMAITSCPILNQTTSASSIPFWNQDVLYTTKHLPSQPLKE